MTRTDETKRAACATITASKCRIRTAGLTCLLLLWAASEACAQWIIPPYTTNYMRGVLASDDANEARADLELPYLNLKDYPYLATGNGSTDETNSVQAAVDAAEVIRAAGGRPPAIFVPAGVYKISNITIPRWCRFIGEGSPQSKFEAVSGATGNMFTDTGYANSISFERVCVSGNNEDVNGIRLGYGSNAPWGSYAFLRDCQVIYCGGTAVDVNSNAATIENCEFYDCVDGSSEGLLYINGDGTDCQDLKFTTYGPNSLTLSGSYTRIRGVHLEGDPDNHITINKNCVGNSIDGIFCGVVSGNDPNSVVSIATGCYNTQITNLYASITSPSTMPTNGLIYDVSYGTRKLTGLAYGTSYSIPSYRNGPGVQVFVSSDVPPTTGTHVTGDWFVSASGLSGKPKIWECSSAGTPGLWCGMETIPGSIAKTANDGLAATDSGRRFSNTGATGSVTLALPAEAERLSFEFVKTANYPFYVDPNDGTDRFQGLGAGVPYELKQVGDSIKVSYVTANTWAIAVLGEGMQQERLLATATVDMQNGDGKTTVYTVPTGVSAIVTKVIIRNPSASLADGSDFDIGDGASADTWKTTIDLSGMTATTDCIVLTNDNTKFTVFDATDAFGIKPATGATADATATMMVYGIEY